MPLDASFIPMQVPPDAKLMGQAILGSSSSWGMGVLVNTWYGPLSNNGEKEHCASGAGLKVLKESCCMSVTDAESIMKSLFNKQNKAKNKVKLHIQTKLTHQTKVK